LTARHPPLRKPSPQPLLSRQPAEETNCRTAWRPSLCNPASQNPIPPAISKWPKKKKGRDGLPPCRRRAMGAFGDSRVVPGFKPISAGPRRHAREEEGRAGTPVDRLIPRSPSLPKKARGKTTELSHHRKSPPQIALGWSTEGKKH
jgi:hypothetical protein